ncbi:hypothetical protein [Paraglaciecola arctica]|uniref:hypothetical protein n=1 Tax=Paraglaciecola arctica TaxID=1128911 RepID=UPI001C074EFC|nr:hypothetical protein [Paraglaciecola arctica]MBU3004260.1 hypothetical protein [Paraglaciecola arctica]
MMQISSQEAHVNHEFERSHEREIIAVKNVSQTDGSTAQSEQTQSRTTEDGAYSLSLSPEQEVQKRSIENLSGRKITIYSENQRLSQTSSSEFNTFSFRQQFSGQETRLQGHFVNENSVLSVSERLYEYERMDYNTTLQLEDSQGAVTSMSLSISYSRELNIEQQLTMTSAEFTDPLVLNIGNKPQLYAEDKQAFDLDSDGQKELIPELASGVWYLAYDRNQNGVIDNGTELFGAQTGQGFNELAELDDNNNGLVEADDDLYKELSLWDGKNSLMSLADGRIQAISLNAANTPFTFTDDFGNAIAQIRQTSVFITDNNSLGAIHQVDIAV